MPIVEVQIVAEACELPPTLAGRLADAIGDVLGSRPRGTWVKLAAIAPQNYAENRAGAELVLPVFVSILQRTDPESGKRKEQSLALAQVIGEICERPTDNVHILFQPPGAGRVAFGGVLVD